MPKLIHILFLEFLRSLKPFDLSQESICRPTSCFPSYAVVTKLGGFAPISVRVNDCFVKRNWVKNP